MSSTIHHYFSKYRDVILTLMLFAVSVFLRVFALKNYPLWVDEFSTASQVQNFISYGFSLFTSQRILLEPNNFLVHLITTIPVKIFGLTPIALRMQAVVFGSLVPIIVYFVVKRFTQQRTTAFISALLVATSYIQITWSLQARGYMLEQTIILISFLCLIKLIDSVDQKEKSAEMVSLGLLGVINILGLATHSMHFLHITSLSIFLLWVESTRNILRKMWKSLLIFFIVLLIVGIYTGFWMEIFRYINSSFFLANNFGYYHSFLWREYTLVSFLGLLGIALLIKKYMQIGKFIIVHVMIYLIFVTFLFGHHMTKYLLPIAPFLYVGMGISLTTIATLIFPRRWKEIALVITLLCIFNGDTFVFKPKRYYSLNHHFREIANIDYDLIYRPILEAVRDKKKPYVIETWPNRGQWYLGNSYADIALFRWGNETGVSNGHARSTPYIVDDDGVKRQVNTNIPLVAELNDIVKAQSTHRYGFIFIDDDTLPRDVIDYAEKNLKKEIFLDHYPLDDNSYSIWPATLYSWGFDTIKL